MVQFQGVVNSRLDQPLLRNQPAEHSFAVKIEDRRRTEMNFKGGAAGNDSQPLEQSHLIGTRKHDTVIEGMPLVTNVLLGHSGIPTGSQDDTQNIIDIPVAYKMVVRKSSSSLDVVVQQPFVI